MRDNFITWLNGEIRKQRDQVKRIKADPQVDYVEVYEARAELRSMQEVKRAYLRITKNA